MVFPSPTRILAGGPGSRPQITNSSRVFPYTQGWAQSWVKWLVPSGGDVSLGVQVGDMVRCENRSAIFSGIPMSSAKSPFEIERHGEIAVITLSPDLDSMHEKDMEAAAVLVLRPLEDNPPDGLIFNLGRVNYMKSLVLSFLLRCHRRVKPNGCEVVVAQPSPLIRELLHTTALDTIWPIYDTLPEAMNALSD